MDHDHSSPSVAKLRNRPWTSANTVLLLVPFWEANGSPRCLSQKYDLVCVRATALARCCTIALGYGHSRHVRTTGALVRTSTEEAQAQARTSALAQFITLISTNFDQSCFST